MREVKAARLMHLFRIEGSRYEKVVAATNCLLIRAAPARRAGAGRAAGRRLERKEIEKTKEYSLRSEEIFTTDSDTVPHAQSRTTRDPIAQSERTNLCAWWRAVPRHQL